MKILALLCEKEKGAPVQDKIHETKKNMEKGLEHLKNELSKLRVGRASTAMLDEVRVQAYGSSMGLKEVAALGIPDAKTITVQPWDKSLIGEIEKAMLAANLGLTPVNDGTTIRMNLPSMTEDRRKDFVKQIKKFGEETKVALRNMRRDAIDPVKSNKTISEDESRKFQEEIQKLTDQFTKSVDTVVDSKSKEVMTI